MARSRIAEAYIQVVPSMGGFFQNFASQTAGSFAAAGVTAGNRMGGFMGPAISKAMDVAKIGAGLATAAGAVATALIAKGGITRALNIEDAQAKLSALKYDAEEIKSISQSAMDSVLNTSYAFDGAMKVAASSLAAGIEKGDDLTKYLKLVTDASTVSGASLEDMGYIFNKIQGNGTAFAQELNMMGDRGLPIFAWLAKEAGVSVAELRKQVSLGKVSAADFRKAVDVNIGGAATTAATTTRSYIANTKAAFSRLGETLFGGVLPIVKQGLIDFIPVIDAMNKKSKDGAKYLWDNIAANTTPAFTEWAKATTESINGSAGLMGNIDKLKASIAGVAGVALGIGASFLASPAGVFIDSMITRTATWYENLKPIGAIWTDSILPAFQQFWTIFGPALTNFFEYVKQVGSAILPVFSTLFTSLMPIFQQLGPIIANIVAMVQGPMYASFASLFEMAGGALVQIIPQVASLIGSVLTILGSGLSELLPSIMSTAGQFFTLMVGVIETVLPIITMLVPIIGEIIKTVLPVIMQIAGIIINVVSNLLTSLGPSVLKLVGVIGELVVSVMTALGPAFERLMPVIMQFVDETLVPLIEALAGILAVVIEVVAGLLQMFMPAIIAIIPIVTEIVKAVTDVVGWIIRFLTSIVAIVANTMINIWNHMADVFNKHQVDVPDWIQDLMGWGPTIGFNIGKLELVDMPKLHTGGNIAGSKNGTPIIAGDKYRAETVTDLGTTNAFIMETLGLVRQARSEGFGAGGSTTVNMTVNPAPGMDEKKLAEHVYRIAARKARLV